MDSQASYRQCASAMLASSRRRHAFGHRCFRLGLIGAFGVLAFLFSVVSPYDDDIQQEVIELHKPKQTILITYKAPSHIRGLRIKTATSSALMPSAHMLVAAVEQIYLPGEADPAKIVGKPIGERSPPANSRSRSVL
jgi:hypothetical protein